MNMAWMDIALLGSVGISWLAVFMALYCMQRLRKQSYLTHKLYQRLNHDLEMTNSGSVGMGRRLIRMEEKFLAAAAQPQVVEMPSHKDAVFEPYSLAAQMINAGVDDAEVARRSGLSRAEASLMQMMHKHVKDVA